MPANDYALSESWFEVLDWAVREAQAQGLRVILDLHEFTSLGSDPGANKVKFLAFWRQLSAHCQGAPESVLFEVLNEPSRKLTPGALERIPGRSAGHHSREEPDPHGHRRPGVLELH